MKWLRNTVAQGLCLMLLFSAFVTMSLADATDTGLLFSDCRIRHVDTTARCATLSVPEDHAAPNGKQINIHVAVLPALARKAEADPVYFFAGGPGQAASDLGRLTAALGNLRKRRDIVLVDQRGTGKSRTLACDTSSTRSDTDPLEQIFVASQESVQRDWARCLATLKGNAALHRTDDYIDDLERVRKALGHVRINVWGGSYGSRVALRYMKRYPASIRTATLDGVAPTSLRLPDDALVASELRLRALLDACQQSAACGSAYPGLGKGFDKLLDDLRSKPQRVMLTHPGNGKIVTGVMTDQALISLIWPMLYAAETSRLVPTLVHQAIQGNFAPLAATLSANSITGEDIAVAQRFAVMCAEDMLGRSPATSAGAQPRFRALMQMFYGFCNQFPKGRVEADFFEPTVSDIPTLLLSGSLDPVTPASAATLVAKTLSRQKHIMVQGMGHIVSPQSCIRRVINRFIEAGSLEAAIDPCEATLALPVPLFYVTPLVARP